MLTIAVVLLAFAALGYQCVAIAAILKFLLRKPPAASFAPPVSILKPVRGLDPGFAAAIASHAKQQYPEFEILFGVADPNDPAVVEIERLRQADPQVDIRLVHSTTRAANGKVGVLIDLAKQAKYGVYLVNDSDIFVPSGYLKEVLAPLADTKIALVTCLYRGAASSWPGRAEALGIATDFAPSTLVAPLFGVNEFGLGSTLAFRKGDLAAIGGFEALADYLADDYQLARHLTRDLGKRTELSCVVVETSLQASSWGEVWRHQVRWHRTIRVSRPGGYAGLPVTFALVWALAAWAAGWPVLGLSVLTARYTMAYLGGAVALQCPTTKASWPLAPLRDLFGAAIWCAGLVKDTVEWRGRTLRISADGRIRE